MWEYSDIHIYTCWVKLIKRILNDRIYDTKIKFAEKNKDNYLILDVTAVALKETVQRILLWNIKIKMTMIFNPSNFIYCSRIAQVIRSVIFLFIKEQFNLSFRKHLTISFY